MQWYSEQDRAASWAALRQRLILAGILADPDAPPETIARALRERQITGPEDVAALWQLVGADGTRARLEALES